MSAFNSILETIGSTPLIRLNRIPQKEGLDCQVFVKCEMFNPGGSIKDRISLAMVEEAERQGVITEGGTLIEATSGNTGVGLAMVGAAKGYKVKIIIPEGLGIEKSKIIEAYGGEVIRVPHGTDVEHGRKMAKEMSNAIFLDQFNNPINPATHARITAKELNSQDNLRLVAAGAGTGGTLLGLRQGLKKSVEILGVDPIGSILGGGDGGEYSIEGIGRSELPLPGNFDREAPDQWIKVSTNEALIMKERLGKEEGILAGESSGAILAGTIKYLLKRHYGRDDTIVAILPDTGRNY